MVMVAVPVWLLLTAVAIQLSPDLNGGTGLTGTDETLVVASWGAWFAASFNVGIWMLPSIPAMMLALMLGRAVLETAKLRAQAEHDRYADKIIGEAVIEDPAWREDR
jgi:hypothetical protein